MLWISLLLLLGNAFFVGAEFAVMAARRSQLEPMAAEGSKRASAALEALENVASLLACAQLGITVCSVLLGAVAEDAVHHLDLARFPAVQFPGVPGGVAGEQHEPVPRGGVPGHEVGRDDRPVRVGDEHGRLRERQRVDDGGHRIRVVRHRVLGRGEGLGRAEAGQIDRGDRELGQRVGDEREPVVVTAESVHEDQAGGGIGIDAPGPVRRAHRCVLPHRHVDAGPGHGVGDGHLAPSGDPRGASGQRARPVVRARDPDPVPESHPVPGRHGGAAAGVVVRLHAPSLVSALRRGGARTSSPVREAGFSTWTRDRHLADLH